MISRQANAVACATVLLLLAVGATPALAADAATVGNALRGPDRSSAWRLYFPCQRTKGTAYEHIAQGSSEWIAVAEQALAYSDGCVTEGIVAALGKAMRKAPERVLPLVDRTTSLGREHICVPFISDELSLREQLRQLQRSRRAIEAVHDPALAPARTKCLEFIETVESPLRERPRAAD
jgi:hypothetical protein